MTFLNALILGILQGITEFLPISSSGHLKLAETFLGLKNLSALVPFDMTCHLGTLLAILVVLRQDVYNILLFRDRPLLGRLILACIPLLPVVFLLHWIKQVMDTPQLLGFFFLFTAAVLLIAEWRAKKLQTLGPPKSSNWKDALWVGCGQAVAVFPGISRAGMTISTAKMLGWSAEEAGRFSFLLAIPTILGGAGLEGIQMLKHPEAYPAIPVSCYCAGFVTSFLVGWLVLSALLKLIKKRSLIGFAWYCAAIGTFALIMLNV